VARVNDNRIKKIAIVGGGTAGWIMASCLARSLERTPCEVVLIESPDIGIIGVGEATIPSFVDFVHFLGVAENEFIQATKATFKLGIKFTDWRRLGHEYWHQFGAVGFNIDAKPFYQHWLKYRMNGGEIEYTEFSPSVVMAKKGKFYIPPQGKKSGISGSEYAWHFDAGLVAEFLANYSLARGVVRIKDTVQKVSLTPSGSIQSLTLIDGSSVDADFYVDCTGQKGLLIGETLGTKYLDWGHYLPVDRAVAVPTENADEINPYTESIARACGWQWRIPLQHRTGNGYVYSSDYCSAEDATALLLDNVKEKPIADPRVLKFTTGKRQQFWKKNCLAVGLSAGFLEPLESTGIYLSMKSALSFIQMFPDINCHEATIREYNRLMDDEYECIRDFIVLHYCVSERRDSKFWRDCRTRPVPDTLREKLSLFRNQGRLVKNDLDLFSAGSWYAVLEGMGVRPLDYDHTIDSSDFERVQKILLSDFVKLGDITESLPSHNEYLDRLATLK